MFVKTSPLIKYLQMKKIIIICLILTNISCVSGSFKGFSSGYKKEKENLSIKFLDEIIEMNQLDKTNIYAINGHTLKTELKRNNKSLVYFWDPLCHSGFCIPLSRVQAYCNKNNINLFVVIDYYDKSILDQQTICTNPIFSINHKYYKTNYSNKFARRFKKDILNETPKDTLIWYKYYNFSNGIFINATNKLQL